MINTTTLHKTGWKATLMLALFLISGPSLFAQKTKTAAPRGTAFFEKTTHNFGAIGEKNGKVTVRFPFKNIGKGPLTIKNVDVSCGCTASDWPRQPIKPGESSVIDATFDPETRPGEFAKTLTVVTDGNPTNIFLTIQGEVYTEDIAITSAFPFQQGHMRFSRYDFNLNDISEFGRDSVVVSVYNSAKRDLVISGITAPPHITYRFLNKVIPAGLSADIIYYFDAARAKDLGPRIDPTFLFTTDDTLAKKIISFRSNIRPDFSMLTPEQLKSAPKATWKETVHDFGEVYLGEIVNYEFEVINKGKSPLTIREADATCGCTVSTFSTEPIKKGKSGKVKVSFNAKGLRGAQDKSITVYTSDPDHPVTVLRIKAKVVVPGVDAEGK